MNQVDILRNLNKFAFFVTIEDLAEFGLNKSFISKDKLLYNTWISSKEHAYFFVDSLDEARLHGKKFSVALRHLENELSNYLSRASLLISCRPSDWRYHADKTTIESILFQINDGKNGKLSSSEKTENAIKIRVVALSVLDETQVKLLAQHYGVSNIPKFITAIQKSSAQIFINRPRDVEWLAAYWISNGQLGTLYELIDHNVEQKLRETNVNRNSTLPANKARLGAVALAGIASLRNKAFFTIPDDLLGTDRANHSLDPSSILSNWSTSEIADLLTRPLFDEATYGRVRIHNQSVQEYLSALWFRQLIKSGMERKAINELLIKEVDSKILITPGLEATVGWLSIFDTQIRERVIDIAPEILISHGDPRNLPLDTRRRVLNRYAERFMDRNRTFLSFEQNSLGRFAEEELVETISEIIKQKGNSEDVLITLFSIIKAGKLKNCSELVFHYASGDNIPYRIRIEAIRAFGEIGEEHQKTQIIKKVLKTEDLDQDIAGTLVDSYYPSPLGVIGIIRLLKRVSPKRQNTLTSLSYLLEKKVPEVTQCEGLITLVGGVVKLIQGDRNEDGTQGYRYSWILHATSKFIGRLSDYLSENEP
ncbi:hypothetical protein K8T06_17845, partial [bacterium]|nr:hypothetical protein [bacterium]